MSKRIPNAHTLDVARLMTHIGKRCIFRERSIFAVVRLSNVYVEDGCLMLALKPVSTPGLPNSLNKVIEVGAAFDYLSFEARYLHASMGSWYLVTHPDTVSRLAKSLPACADKQAMLPEFYAQIDEQIPGAAKLRRGQKKR